MEWLRATYLIRSTPAEIEARSAALAVEQSVEMPLDAVRQERIRREVVARVAGIEVVDGAAADHFEIQLDLATSTIGGDLAQLLNMAFGNCSLQPDVQLVDLDLEPALLPHLRGPRFGVEGLRRLVRGDGRALTCTALKPQGQSPVELADLAATFARAGIDLIKDDHGLANQQAAPFERRVAACQQAVAEANRRSGGASRYAPSLVGGPRQIARQARQARDEGVEVVLVAPMLTGLAGFAELFGNASTGVEAVGNASTGVEAVGNASTGVEAVGNASTGVEAVGNASTGADPPAEGAPLDGLAVLAHPALGGAGALAPPLLFGKLFRLVGADAVIFTNHGGRFAVTEASCRALADNARRPWGGLRPSLPVPAGGMTPQRVPELIRFYGDDVAVLIGGALLQAGPELETAAQAFVAATRAASTQLTSTRAAPPPPAPIRTAAGDGQPVPTTGHRPAGAR
jgi:S-methyl-5-thioribulose 1-phosphate isomerase